MSRYLIICFKYKIVKRPDGTTVKTPSIPLQLQGDQSFDTLALVDSGADVSAIPKSIAEILGLDLSGKKTYAYGIGGKVKSITSKMRVKIDKGHEHYNFQIPVMVIFDNNRNSDVMVDQPDTACVAACYRCLISWSGWL